MKILLITPPLVQMNTPYPATPVLAGFLTAQGQEVVQADLSLELALRLFSRQGLTEIAQHCRQQPKKAPVVRFFLKHFSVYRDTVELAIAFLQGRAPNMRSLTARIARREVFPEGPRLEALAHGEGISPEEAIRMLFKPLSTADRAKLLASLYLDDLADVIRLGVDPDFGFSRYAERLAVAMPSFDPIIEQLKAPPSWVAQQIDALAEAALKQHLPDCVGLTIPFPGAVVAAFRIAAVVRRIAPQMRIVMGGGYVNTELRQLTDLRVFDYVDELCFDEGFAPWMGILCKGPRVRTQTRTAPLQITCAKDEPVYTQGMIQPRYEGLVLSRYFNLLESTNPMHRLWSDGKWLKVPIANGCYWHKCAFCDVGLDYIGRYQPPRARQVVDVLEALVRTTGLTGFHFTDEALAPALIRKICEEIIKRKLVCTWWGNIRFEKAFDAGLARLMAQAGCIAVTGGLECANDRLLKMMNKGITCASAVQACAAFADAGILVHAYLMYGFPTQTEAETIGALETVRQLFEAGVIQSAYWHRFALTVHSPIAQTPERFGIRLIAEKGAAPIFACNETQYEEPAAPDHDRLGEGLHFALYNFMLGLGLDVPVEEWFER